MQGYVYVHICTYIYISKHIYIFVHRGFTVIGHNGLERGIAKTLSAERRESSLVHCFRLCLYAAPCEVAKSAWRQRNSSQRWRSLAWSTPCCLVVL